MSGTTSWKIVSVGQPQECRQQEQDGNANTPSPFVPVIVGDIVVEVEHGSAPARVSIARKRRPPNWLEELAAQHPANGLYPDLDQQMF